MPRNRTGISLRERVAIIKLFDGPQRLLIGVSLGLESAFVLVIFALPPEQRLWAFCVFSGIMATVAFLTIRSAGVKMQNDRILLNNDRAKELFRMYQRSLAYAQLKVFDVTIAELQAPAAEFKRHKLVDRLWQKAQECREETAHFENASLGSIHQFLNRFTKKEYESIISAEDEAILSSRDMDPIDKLRHFRDKIDRIQADLRRSLIHYLENPPSKTRSKQLWEY